MGSKSEPESDEPLRERSTAERLIDVAGEIFAAKGHSATVREICSAANCSVAAINYYFGDKNQLYLQCVKTASEKKQKLFPLPSAEQLDDEPESLLRIFIMTISRRLAGQSSLSWHNTLMLREVLEPSEGVAEMLQTAFQREFTILELAIGRLLGHQDSSALRSEFAAQILARCMFLRTGKNIRKMINLDSPANEDPETYAESICKSILFQIRAMHGAEQASTPIWQVTTNHTTDDSSIKHS